MPDVDNILTSFYQLDDNSRKAIEDMIGTMLEIHRDPLRAEDIKKIKRW